MRILVVGARTARQGTGPFIAAAFNALGAEICAIVGTSEASVAEARAQLSRNHRIDCDASYTDLEQALRQEQPDAVALCSPWRFHAEQLALIAAAGCHCLAEKPLLWPASTSQLDQLLQGFEQRGKLLKMVAQWPLSLPAFAALHGPIPASPSQFRMRLSPISIGPDMVTDSAPHFISMLHALWGPGSCDAVEIKHCNTASEQGLSLHCEYRGARGNSHAELLLQTCAERPRPAWYEIDGLRVEREVELPEYRQYLVGAGNRARLPDPMREVVAGFLAALAARQSSDRSLLQSAHTNLHQLGAAWR